MPLYEYYCSDCRVTFDLLRAYDLADHGVRCASCAGERVSRTVSLTAPIGKDAPELGSAGCACGGRCSCAGH